MTNRKVMSQMADSMFIEVGVRERHVAAGLGRGVLWLAIYDALRAYRLSNMGDEDGGAYPLVDLMTPDGRSISEGEQEMVNLADDVLEGVRKVSAPIDPNDEEQAWNVKLLRQLIERAEVTDPFTHEISEALQWAVDRITALEGAQHEATLAAEGVRDALSGLYKESTK
jgi:hypothetical protein